MAWIRFFLGTPQRFLWTLGMVGLVVVAFTIKFHPGYVESLIHGFVREVVMPIATYAAVLFLVYLGYRIVLGPLLRR